MMKKYIFIFFLMVFTTAFSQGELSLTECYSLAEKYNPIAKQNELIPQQNELNTDIIKTKKYPKIDLDAQATYQSDVIHFPVDNPGLIFELPNKDQYRATATLNQLIYGGGTVNALIDEENSKSKTQKQTIQVELYQIKPKINQLYFSVLLLQEKKNLLLAKQKQLIEKLNEIKAGIKYGAVLPSSDSVLEAELLKINQQLIEIESSKLNLFQTLEKYLGIEITESITFIYPEITETLSGSVNRPELDLFNLQKEQIDYTSTKLAKNRLPKVYGFAQGGKKQSQALEINKQYIDTEKEKFDLNTSIQLEQQIIEINKYKDFTQSDKSIIELHKQILNTADSQLKN